MSFPGMNRYQYLKQMQGKSRRTCQCICGHIHDSRGEAAYCDILFAKKKAGEIKDYERQKMYDLKVNGVRICGHRVDFVVTHNDGHIEVEEYKGFLTEIWALKHKLFEAIYPKIPYRVIKPK
jgi:hypothetical protein